MIPLTTRTRSVSPTLPIGCMSGSRPSIPRLRVSRSATRRPWRPTSLAGRVVDEAEPIETLAAGRIVAAGIDVTMEETLVPSYTGDRGLRCDWGYGCGSCSAYELRSDGWHAYSQSGEAA
jgi:hypothetical protein